MGYNGRRNRRDHLVILAKALKIGGTPLMQHTLAV